MDSYKVYVFDMRPKDGEYMGVFLASGLQAQR